MPSSWVGPPSARPIASPRRNGRRGKAYVIAAPLEASRHSAPILLTSRNVIGPCHSAANLPGVEACLTVSPLPTFGAIDSQLLLSLAKLRRDGKVLRNGRHCGRTGRR